MSLFFKRFMVVVPVLLMLLLFSSGTVSASNVGHPGFNINSLRRPTRPSTAQKLHVTQLHMNDSGTHYLYVDDGTCPNSIDVYAVGASLTHVGNYTTPGCTEIGLTGTSNIAIAPSDSYHGPCLIYAGDANNTGFLASYPINYDGSLGAMASQVYTLNGVPYGGVVVELQGLYAFSSEPGVDLESFAIGYNCNLAFAAAESTGNATNFGMSNIADLDLVTPDIAGNNIDTYRLGSNGNLTFLYAQPSQITLNGAVTVETLNSQKGLFRVYTAGGDVGSLQAQGGNYNLTTGVITPLQHSPVLVHKAYYDYGVIFDNTHHYLIMGIQQSGHSGDAELANISVPRGRMKFVSKTPLAVSSDTPSIFAQDGSTLFVDSTLNGDVEGCTLSASGASGCVTVATLTNTSGTSSGMALY